MRKIKRRRKIIIAALAVIILAAVIHYYPRRRFGDGRVRLVITKTSLGKMLPGYAKESGDAISSDCTRLAYIVKRGEKQAVVVDGQAGPEYDDVGWVVFSPDGGRLAYTAERAGKYFVVADGVQEKQYDNIDWLHFSPDGGRLAYTAERAGKYFVVVDGVEGKEYDYVGWQHFSPDSGRLAYGARRKNRWLVVADGVEGKEYDEVSLPCFSPDSGRLAYTATLRNKCLIVVDGTEEKEYVNAHFTLTQLMHFSPDSKHLAYIVWRASKSSVVLDAVEHKRYDNVYSCGFTPDGKLFLTVNDGGKNFVVVDDVEGKRHRCGWISAVGFSMDGEHVWYTVNCREPLLYLLANRVYGWMGWGNPLPKYSFGQFLVVDGIEDKKYDFVSAPVFSADGKHVAYLAQRNGEWVWVVDGIKRRKADFVCFWPPIMDESIKPVYATEDNGEIFRIEARLEPGGLTPSH